MSIEKVPQQSRDLVLVVPESVDLKPGTVVVADLRKAKADGSFPYRLVGTAELDRQLDERFAPQKGANTDTTKSAKAKAAKPSKARAARTIQKKDIIMFSASWCGVCKQASRWFNNKGIPFTEKDVEKTPGARQEMHQLAQKAGIPASQLSGVPVISVKGKIVQGFNPQTIERLLANLSSL
ncbi:MAG TPA: glutaredoxin family protein [Myxococcales bacterium]|nr:glutaredoxin family protein [Myxococcales bacterium]